jgi:hypothetical protein
VEPERQAPFFVPGGARSFSANWFREFEHWYLSALCAISAEHPLWIMRPTPVMPTDIASVMGREALINRDIDLSLPRREYDLDNAYIRGLQDKAAQHCSVHVLDPITTLCGERLCIAETNGLPVYRDNNHLTEYGNRLLIPMFQSIAHYAPPARPMTDPVSTDDLAVATPGPPAADCATTMPEPSAAVPSLPLRTENDVEKPCLLLEDVPGGAASGADRRGAPGRVRL